MIAEISARHEEWTQVRRDLHAHPELAFEERRTADIVAERLQAMGLEVQRGIGKTGVVATLRAGNATRSVGLRADMDALPNQEAGGAPHASRVAGTMHGCGHDGHTTMLLAAARHLAMHRNFDGVVHFIFQPAEEIVVGGKAMIADGLFERFHCDSLFGLHNLPGLPVGTFAVTAGPFLASADFIRIVVRGTQSHAAFPHQGADPIVAASQIVMGIQALATRRIDPAAAAVISITKIAGGNSWNTIPDEVVIEGTVRSILPDTRDKIERALQELVPSLAAAHATSAILTYERRCPPTINAPQQSDTARQAAAAVVGAEHVRQAVPSMACDDIGWMLGVRPGAHVLIGNGDSAHLHHPAYDFDDRIIPLGASFWVRLVETCLPRAV